MKREDYWLKESKLKDPLHDEICFWIVKNWREVLSSEIKETHYTNRLLAYEDEGKYFEEGGYGRENKEIKKEEFQTMKNEWELKEILDMKNLFESKPLLEFAIPNKYVHAFIDVFIPFEKPHLWKFDGKEFLGIMFEVKPKIKELGSVIRQIAHYRKHFCDNLIVFIVSNSKLNKDQIEILKSQNIFYFYYKKEDKKNERLPI